jgi:GntR family transcriptional repressor for pyruvate dehydrogenase complex
MLRRARQVGNKPLIDDHRAIIDSLKSRDPKAARTAMHEHLGRVVENLLVSTELDAMERARSESAARREEIARRLSI